MACFIAVGDSAIRNSMIPELRKSLVKDKKCSDKADAQGGVLCLKPDEAYCFNYR
jgi:hypothetical protein